MNKIMEQVKELAPSAREPLFRRLMVAEELSYLREKSSIMGFEVDMGSEQALSGFTLIAIQKHTIYAFCSDLHEAPKLILFPPIDKLFDPSFELLGLTATKRLYSGSDFSGRKLEHGVLKELVRDITPPEKEVDIPQAVSEQMAAYIAQKKAMPRPVELKKEEPPQEPFLNVPPEVDDEELSREFNSPPDDYEGYDSYDSYEGYDSYDGYEGYDSYDGYEGYDNYEGYGEPMQEPEPIKEPEPAMDERSRKLKAQEFGALSEVSDFCTGMLKVPRSVAVELVNRVLQSPVSPEYRISLAVTLFCKLFDEKRI